MENWMTVGALKKLLNKFPDDAFITVNEEYTLIDPDKEEDGDPITLERKIPKVSTRANNRTPVSFIDLYGYYPGI